MRFDELGALGVFAELWRPTWSAQAFDETPGKANLNKWFVQYLHLFGKMCGHCSSHQETSPRFTSKCRPIWDFASVKESLPKEGTA